MSFSADSKVKDIALANPAARQILEDAGVDYCCGGGKSLHDACMNAGAAAEEILEKLRASALNVFPEDANWMAAPVCELTKHIRERHHAYVRGAIARLRPLIAKVAEKHSAEHPEILEIAANFAEVSCEMTMHMQKEEQILFPYIDSTERAANGKGNYEMPFFQTVKNPIFSMMKEHDAAGDLVKRIRKLSSEYAAPAGACTSFKALYQELREFEADLHQHVHLENNILFPRAVEMEAAIPQRG